MQNQNEPDPWDEPDEHDDQFIVYGAPTGRFPKGYTDEPALAARNEPQALTKRQWKDHVAKDANQRRAAREAGVELELRLLSQEERIVKATAEAKRLRRSVTRNLWVIEQMKAKGRSPDAIEKQVQALERNVYLGRAA